MGRDKQWTNWKEEKEGNIKEKKEKQLMLRNV